MIDITQQVGVFVWDENEDKLPVVEPRETRRDSIFADRNTGDDPTKFGYWMLNYRLVAL